MSKQTHFHTIEIHLSDEEYHRVKLIAAVQNITPAKLYRNELKFWIAEGMYDEVLTGHDCPWVG